MRYRAYGIALECDRELPELIEAPCDGAPALTIRLLGEPGEIELPREWFFDEEGIRAARYGDGYLYDFYRGTFFRLNAGGTEITLLRAHKEVGPELLRHFVLDHVLPRSFNLRGDEVVHATSVVTPAGICAFVGRSGMGKSTMAACFAAAGCPVATDDCMILRELDGAIVAVPGYPGVRLMRESIEPIYGRPVRAISLGADYGKERVLPLSESAFVDAPGPLRRIYVLERLPAGAQPTIRPLARRAAFMSVVKDNTLRFNPHDRAALIRELEFFERVVSVVQVRSCGVPEGLSALPATREAILADLRDG